MIGVRLIYSTNTVCYPIVTDCQKLKHSTLVNETTN